MKKFALLVIKLAFGVVLALNPHTTQAAVSGSVRIYDDGDPGFSVSSLLSWAKTSNLGFKDDFLSAIGLLSGSAKWTVALPAGPYRVSLTWHNPGSPYNIYYSPSVPVTLSAGGKTLLSTVINQRTTPNDRTDSGVGWKDLGTIDLTSGPLTVEISAVASLYVIADGLRIERTDGKPITSPTVTGFAPSSSPLSGGIPVSIRGTQFTPSTRVFFGDAESRKVTFVSASEVIVEAPANPEGTYQITVDVDGMAATRDGFKYAAIRTLDDGQEGFKASATPLVINKLGFQSDYCQPGGTATAWASWTLPVNRTATHSVAVTWYNPGAPYNALQSSSAQFEVMDGGKLLATIPVNLQTTPNDFTWSNVGWKKLGEFVFSSGEASVYLRNNTTRCLVADAIRLEELKDAPRPAPGPVLGKLSPASGPVSGGTQVVLSGSGFVKGATVRFGSAPAAKVSFTSSSSITALTPEVSEGGTVTVKVTNPDGASSSLADAFTFVAPLPTVSVTASDAVAGEPGTGEGTGTFQFTRTGSVSAPLTVNYKVTGTASAGADYKELSGTVTFKAGAATAEANVEVLDDSLLETKETIRLVLASGPDYVVGTPSSATVSVLSDDFPTVIVEETDPAAGEPGSADGKGLITFRRDGAVKSALTVNIRVAGTATAGQDYSPLPANVTFAEGSSTATLVIEPLKDDLVEGAETVVVSLVSGPEYVVGTPSRATVTISEEVILPTVTVKAADADAGEPLSGAGTGTFTFARTGSTSTKLEVFFAVSGTADAKDFAPLGTSVVFPVGESTVTRTVEVIDDEEMESRETVEISIKADAGYTVGTPSTAAVTIADDDLPVVSVEGTDTAAGEPGTGQGRGEVTFTRSGPTDSELQVNLAISGTALNGTDYSAIGKTITFPKGSSTTTLRVNVLDDSSAEESETVIIKIAAGANYRIGTPKKSTITIADDDGKTGDDVETGKSDFVTGFTPGALRNNLNGRFGFRFAVGTAPLTVNALGRIYIEGNSESHELQLVNADSGAVIASTTWTPADGVNGQIKYAALPQPITLDANSVYYLVSQETIGGDRWYNNKTTVSTTDVASVISAIHSEDGTTWSRYGGAGQTFGPVSFRYEVGTGQMQALSLTRQSLSAPVLNIRNDGQTTIISWPARTTTYVLEESADLGQLWTPVQANVEVVDGKNVVTLNKPEGMRFYRLTEQ